MSRLVDGIGSRLVAAFVVAAVVAGGLVAGTALLPAQQAEAANAALFDPGYIISDSQFFTSNAMSEAEIQTFLELMAPGICGANGCLKQLRMDTVGKPQYFSDTSGRVECTSYLGETNESAARIIYKVQQACGISAKVILVTLQKERGVVTKTSPIPADFTVAMGFGCPDTAACDVNYYGFQNQVWMGARQFKAYRAAPAFFKHRAGTTVNVLYHPDSARCGSSPVYISNVATAALYNYTPYQPNSAALGNLYGSGDTCSSYGNRNFWAYYTDWFGSTTGNTSPTGFVDSVTAPRPATINIQGWAFDPNSPSPIDVHVYVDNAFAGGWAADRSRLDVQLAYPMQGTNHGFDVTFASAAGTHRVCVYGINTGPGLNTLISCSSVVVQAVSITNALGWLDSVSVKSAGAAVQGWAFDPSTSSPINVHVYADGRFAAGFTADASRPDLSSAFPGRGANHGFEREITLAPGTHEVCAFALNSAMNSAIALGCRGVKIPTSEPRGYLDSASAESGGIRVVGWAFDPTATTPTSVHVYIDNAFERGFAASTLRTDVQAAFPAQSASHGFDTVIPVGPGAHRLCAYALNVASTSAAAIGCAMVTVPAGLVDTLNG